MCNELPNEYSILVESWEDVQSVIDSGFIDCAFLKYGDLGYMYPAYLYIDHGKMIEWDYHETNTFTIYQWKSLSVKQD